MAENIGTFSVTLQGLHYMLHNHKQISCPAGFSAAFSRIKASIIQKKRALRSKGGSFLAVNLTGKRRGCV
jgi:hypothetical protein